MSMMTYTYDAYTMDSTKVSGKLVAASEDEVRSTLKERGLVVVEVAPENIGLAAKELRIGKRKVKMKQVAWMARQLATSQISGLPLVRAIGILARQTAKTPIGEVLTDIYKKVSSGVSVTEAFTDHEDDLGPLSIALISAGEASGQLDLTLAKLADITEARVRLRQKVVSAMTYPALVTIAVGIITLVMLLFVVPTFENIYKTLHGTLPIQTRILIAISNLLLHNIWLLGLAAVVGYALFNYGRHNESVRLWFDGIVIKAPIFGRILSMTAIARVEATMASLLIGGVPLLDALDHAGAVCGNRAYAKALQEVKQEIRDKGTQLSHAMAKQEILPELLTQLVAVGEETGEMPDLLNRRAIEDEREVSTTVDGLSSLIEPILILFMGVVVGGILISLYLPMFKVVSLIHN